jgi:hypothetical protein
MEEIQGGRRERVSWFYKIPLEDMIEAIEGQFSIHRSLCRNLGDKSDS